MADSDQAEKAKSLIAELDRELGNSTIGSLAVKFTGGEISYEEMTDRACKVIERIVLYEVIDLLRKERRTEE